MIPQPTETTPPKLLLDGLRVGIAGAVPERGFWGDVPDLDRLILSFVAQLSGLVIKHGGQIVHGSQPLLAPVVAEQARRQAHEGTTALKLFASQLFGELPDVTRNAASVAQAEVVLTARLGKGDAKDPETFNHSLTAMRLAMTQQVDVLVAVGGKLHVDTGFNPGVFEELAQAHWHGVPCFVVGAFSGAAGQLDHSVLDELSAGNLMGETLPAAQMAAWDDTMDEYVGKLLGHLARHMDQFRRTRPPQYASEVFKYAKRSLPAGARPMDVNVVHVDSEVARAWLERFAALRQCIEKKDTEGAHKLLATSQF